MNNNIRGLAKLASKDTTRPTLMGVNVTKERIMACDGYILGYVGNDTDIEPGNYPARPINNQVLVITKKDNQAHYLRKKMGVISLAMIEGEYPDIDKVIPSDEVVKHHSVTLGIAVLEPLVQAMKASKNKAVELFFAEDSLSPIKGKMGEIELVIMPVRGTK